jgi:hypothetical protein
MNIQPLPQEIEKILQAVHAPPRLVAHLRVVHDAALTITTGIAVYWPILLYDKQAVLVGAATHDIGKIIYPNELTGAGNKHEMVGPDLLVQYGVPSNYARFASTHGQWNRDQAATLEDLLVALADTIWKGSRNSELETRVSKTIALLNNEEAWSVFLKLDDLIGEVVEVADARVLWQGQFSASQ